MMDTLRRLLVAAPRAISSTACGALLEPPSGEALIVGTVAFHGDPVVIEVPDTVVAGVPFTVGVHTYGGGCERMGPTELTVDARSAVVVPYDFTETGDDVACTAILKTFDHEVALRLDVPGEATVTIRGREEPSNTVREYPRRVWVRP